MKEQTLERIAQDKDRTIVTVCCHKECYSIKRQGKYTDVGKEIYLEIERNPDYIFSHSYCEFHYEEEIKKLNKWKRHSNK